MMRGNTIRGVVEGDSDPQLHVPELLGLWKQGRFPVDRLVRHYPFAKINEAVEDAVRGDVIKPVLLFD
jgi:aryl-alcohol dehydrogenase